MAVFRVEKNSNYTTISNFVFKDKRLSWKAKGILANMLSLPDNWDYSLAGLTALSSDGQTATRTALKELEDAGYLIRRPLREKGKILDWEYQIFETPQTEKPLVENPQLENQVVENQLQLNTKELNTNLSNTKEKKKVSKASFDAIIAEYTTDETTVELLGEWLKVRKAKRAAMTDRAIQSNINKLDGFARESKMTVNDYLEEVIRKGWAAFYPINSYGNNQKADASKWSQMDNETRAKNQDLPF